MAEQNNNPLVFKEIEVSKLEKKTSATTGKVFLALSSPRENAPGKFDVYQIWEKKADGTTSKAWARIVALRPMAGDVVNVGYSEREYQYDKKDGSGKATGIARSIAWVGDLVSPKSEAVATPVPPVARTAATTKPAQGSNTGTALDEGMRNYPMDPEIAVEDIPFN